MDVIHGVVNVHLSCSGQSERLTTQFPLLLAARTVPGGLQLGGCSQVLMVLLAHAQGRMSRRTKPGSLRLCCLHLPFMPCFVLLSSLSCQKKNLSSVSVKDSPLCTPY